MLVHAAERPLPRPAKIQIAINIGRVYVVAWWGDDQKESLFLVTSVSCVESMRLLCNALYD